MYEDYDFLTIEEADKAKMEVVFAELDANPVDLNDDSLKYDTGITDIDILLLRDVKGLVTKKNISDVFEVGLKTAQSIMIHMETCGYAWQEGRKYYTTREHLSKYICDFMGKKVDLQP